MSRRPIATIALFAPLVLIVAATLTGCGSGSPAAQPTNAPTGASTGPAQSTPTATPTPTFIPDNYTCESILPPATLVVFKSKASAGFTLQKDYVERVHNFDPNLSLFDDYHGILCQWAYPSATRSVDYGFSAITDQQAATEQATLTKNGYAGTPGDNGTVFANSDTTDFPDTYLFIKGYWFYASDKTLLDLIVENVFSTPDE
ncbi:MAG: hypothetical protein QOF79_81 [Actinomycetota bacterium]|jgi:hypothetical protein|nr:hypothetical protein [Actinomycetota bacterium]